MEHTTYASRLRYLAAGDVDDSVVKYDGLDVEGPDGARIGGVDGFILDTQACRLQYLVIDSGGWFRSRRFLLPVGHATLSSDRTALRVDVTRPALSRYPEFDEDRFREFSDDEMQLFEQRMAAACCPEDAVDQQYGMQRHYTQPDWSTSMAHAHERVRTVDTGASPPAADGAANAAADGAAASSAEGRGETLYIGSRAQPGDVLGVETGGERTQPGDTAHDEHRASRKAERALGTDEDEPRQSER